MKGKGMGWAHLEEDKQTPSSSHLAHSAAPGDGCEKGGREESDMHMMKSPGAAGLDS